MDGLGRLDQLEIIQGDHVRVFYYRHLEPIFGEPKRQGLLVWDCPRPLDTDPYFELKGELAEGFIQLKVITHNNHPRLKGKGLPAGTMAELHRLTGLPIRSSMGLNPADGTDRRSPEATAMWEKWRPEGWRLTIWGPSQEPTISSIRPPFSQTPEGHCRHADHSRLSYGNNQFIGYQCLTG